MSQVTVASTTIPNYQAGGTTATIRIFATEDFFTSDGLEVQAGHGQFYKDIDCTVSGTTVTIPSFTIDSTTDSSNDTAKYVAVLYNSQGGKVSTLMGGLEFSVQPNTPTTWNQLYIAAQAVQRRLPDQYSTTQEVLNLLEDRALKSTVDGVISALGDKADLLHSHGIADVTGLSTALSGKQATLVSGTNIKTINGSSILGSGDLTVSGGGGAPAWGDLTGTIADQTDLQAALDAKQDDLVSGTNIKTVNSSSLLGSGNILISPSRGSLFFDQDNPQTVNCGQFYHPSVVYGHFMAEAWVKFTKPSTDGYAFIDGFGGAHINVLGAVSNTEDARLTGKYYEGSPDYGDGDETFGLDQWTHIAHAWDGTHYMQWINGSLTYITADSSPRTMTAGSTGIFFIGGPGDHSMWEGYIAQVRVWEGNSNMAGALPNGYTDMYPERYFRPIRYIGGTYYRPAGMWDLTTPACTYPDQGEGFDPTNAGGTKYLHSGTLAGTTPSSADSIPYSTDALPTFVTGDISKPTYAPTAPSVPVGAVVFDSFSRPDTTYAFYKNGDSVAGSTEGGSAGVKTWSTQTWPIRGGRLAYWKNYSSINTVDCGISNVDVRVDRTNTAYCHTGLTIRYTDANNYIRVLGYPDALVVESVEAGTPVLKYSNLSLTTNYTTLRAVVNGTSLTVYRDGTSFGPFTVPSSSATVHGLYAPGTANKNINRFDNFTVYAA